ncbi:MAG: PDZ domain-containing protein [Candidatus Dormibacteraeota bacterium]|nr:PDZ domain-containing protein [Candidatus Dormibacteraeota bacterium]
MSEKKKGLFNRMFSPNGDNNDEPTPEEVARWLNEPDGRRGYRPSRPDAYQGPSFGTPGASRPTGMNGSQARAFSDLAAGFGGGQNGPWSSQDFAADAGVDDDGEGGGVEVGDVGAGGPLAAAGVRPGDVIVAVDGSPVDDEEDLFEALGSIMPGRSAVLEIVRGDTRLTAAVIAPQ